MEIILLDACDILTLSNGGDEGDEGIVIENLNSLISGS